jgi:hypothetical protein
MLSVFDEEEVEFLVVGAYAMAAHGAPRATGDLDFWIRPSEENAGRVIRALMRFGAPINEIAVEDFVTRDLVFQIGIEPNRIDLLTSIDGVDFGEAWENRVTVEVGGVPVPVLGLADLVRNKKAVGRLRDLADVEELNRLHPE